MDTKDIIAGAIQAYQQSMCRSLDIGSLYQRNKIAHKWKVTFAVYVIRETASWRFVDIAKQAFEMGNSNSIVGARILTRAAIETLATLVYMNMKMEEVISGKISFAAFCESIYKVYMGSRTDKQLLETINVLTMVKKMEKKHKGILQIYEELCETAHPSYIGLTDGYSKIDTEKYITSFGNYWLDKYGRQHEAALLLCMKIFELEYNDAWINNFHALEEWLVNNDSALEKNLKKKS